VLLEVQQCERVGGTFHVTMSPYWVLSVHYSYISIHQQHTNWRRWKQWGSNIISTMTVRTWNILRRQNWKTYTSASG